MTEENKTIIPTISACTIFYLKLAAKHKHKQTVTKLSVLKT